MTIGAGRNTIHAVKSPILSPSSRSETDPLPLSPSSRSVTDPLSDVLSLLKPMNYMCGGIDAGEEWSFYTRPHDVTRCFALVSGECWLLMDGVPEPVRLIANDCVLMPHGRGFRLAPDLALEPVDGMENVVTQPSNGRIIQWNGGGNGIGLTAVFAFQGEHASMLLEALPPLMHLRDRSEQATMQWCLQRMMRELREPQPGGFLLGQHLAHMMLVEALRLYLADEESHGVGWLLALGDKQMRAAMTAIHDDPAHAWTLEELGSRAGMSRSKFAFKFKERVGTSPMEYLTRWRMLRAADRLVNSSESISDISIAVGYESESAFGAAFKKAMGSSPRQYCRARAAYSLECRNTRRT
jgi:AraC-like DNA-binding protein